MVKRGLGLLLMVGVWALGFFTAAGRLDVPFAWAYLGLLLAVGIVAMCVVDPALMKERSKPGEGGTDRHLRAWAMPFFCGHVVLAGADVGRWHLSDTIPAGAQVAGLVLLAGSYALSTWSMHVNRFFSSVVRIQHERGHALVTNGPYRFIRHPGYLAGLLLVPSSGLALGSWMGFAVLGPVVFLLLRRIVVEDRFLHAELPGYSAYAADVRYRVIPGVW